MYKSYLKGKLNYRQRQFVKRIFNKTLSYGKPKIFCISMQRTGTTSVGTFLNDHGIPTAGYNESKYYNWGYYWKIGDYKSIFNNKGFKSYRGFQDGPFWSTDFYKILYHQFPNSKFILLTRESSEWFASMLKHSKGKNPGNTYTHCKIYGRMSTYFEIIGDDKIKFNKEDHVIDNLLEISNYENHYCEYYENYNKEVIQFFEHFDPDKLFTCNLNDPEKWKLLGDFLQIKVKANYEAYSNKSK